MMKTLHEKYFIPQYYRLIPAYENPNSMEAIYGYLFTASILMTRALYVERTLGRH